MSDYSIEEARKLLENDKFTLQEKHKIAIAIKDWDRAKKFLLKIVELENSK
jgi:hypothetical protein